jgi:hypothetical protein
MFGFVAFAALPFASIVGNIYSSAVNETATATDAELAQQTFASVVSETVTGTDADTSGDNTFNPSLTEAATATDETNSILAAIGGVVSESAAVSDAFIAQVNFAASIAETAAAADSLGNSLNFAASVNESASATDQATSVFLWNVIDDSQNANWNDINNTQSTSWTDVVT